MNLQQPTTYRITFIASVNDFASQRNVTPLPAFIISFTDVDSFKSHLYEIVKEHVEREVVYTSTPTANPVAAADSFVLPKFAWYDEDEIHTIFDRLGSFVRFSISFAMSFPLETFATMNKLSAATVFCLKSRSKYICIWRTSKLPGQH